LSPSKLTQNICSICVAAADRIMEVYATDFSVEKKDDHSPLTTADLASHEAICTQLSELVPEYPILSEESANIPFSERKYWDRYWLIDPLDGTKEFIKKNGEFTVNIALIEQHKPILGVVHVPVTGISYFATAGQGAYKQCPGEQAKPIKVKASTTNNITIAGSRSHGNEKQQNFIKNLGVVEVIAIGSSLKFCLVAEGKVDIYPRFGPTSEWDSAAAQCIVEEAGGQVVDISFNQLKYNTKESLLNPEFLAIADNSYNWKKYLS